jgi:deoxyribonuclease V
VKLKSIHRWDLEPRAAIALQRDLAKRVTTSGGPMRVETVAGVDLGFSRDGSEAIAGVIVYSYPDLEEIERKSARGPVPYPYIPGLLSFREGPVLEMAFAEVSHEPDVVLFDGQGIAHPRRLGIASHMGLLLERPTIGCAKSRLCGGHEEPGPKRGDWVPLVDGERGETIGAVLRTRDRVKPIYVSSGHLISLEASIDIVMRCLDRTRIPKPTREADKFVKMLK